eukprot:scaffold322867_cov52-Prasinocladus_malaysianus.AAC.1
MMDIPVNTYSYHHDKLLLPLADTVTLTVKVSIACDAQQSQVSGSGLVKGKPLVYADVQVQCYDSSGIVRNSGEMHARPAPVFSLDHLRLVPLCILLVEI